MSNLLNEINPYSSQGMNPQWIQNNRRDVEKEEEKEGSNEPSLSFASSFCSSSLSPYSTAYSSRSSLPYFSTTSSMSSSTPTLSSRNRLFLYSLNIMKKENTKNRSSLPSHSNHSFSSSLHRNFSSKTFLSQISDDCSSIIFSFLNVKELVKIECVDNEFFQKITHFWSKTIPSECVELRLSPHIKNPKKLRYTFTLILDSFIVDFFKDKLRPKNFYKDLWIKYQSQADEYPPFKYLFAQCIKSYLNEDKLKSVVGNFLSQEEIKREEKIISDANLSSDGLIFSILEAIQTDHAPNIKLISTHVSQAIENKIFSAPNLLRQIKNGKVRQQLPPLIMDLGEFNLKTISAINNNHSDLIYSIIENEREFLFITKRLFNKQISITEIHSKILEIISFKAFEYFEEEHVETIFNELIKRWKVEFKIFNLNILKKIADFAYDFEKEEEVISICKNFFNTNKSNLNSNDMLNAIILLDLLKQRNEALYHLDQKILKFIEYKIKYHLNNKNYSICDIISSLVRERFSFDQIPTSVLLIMGYLEFHTTTTKRPISEKEFLNERIKSIKQADEIYTYVLKNRQNEIFSNDLIIFSKIKYHLKEYGEAIRLLNLCQFINSTQLKKIPIQYQITGTLVFILSKLNVGDIEAAKSSMHGLLKVTDNLSNERLSHYSLLTMIKILHDLKQVEKADSLLTIISFNEIKKSLPHFWQNLDFDMIDFIYENILPKFNKTNEDLKSNWLYLFGKAKLFLNKSESENLKAMNLLELSLKKLNKFSIRQNHLPCIPEIPVEAIVNVYKQFFNLRKNPARLFFIDFYFKKNAHQVFPPEFLINEPFNYNLSIRNYTIADECFLKAYEGAKKMGKIDVIINEKTLYKWVLVKSEKLKEIEVTDKILDEYIKIIGAEKLNPILLNCSASIKKKLAKKV